jgi:hypothetical protein
MLQHCKSGELAMQQQLDAASIAQMSSSPHAILQALPCRDTSPASKLADSQASEQAAPALHNLAK